MAEPKVYIHERLDEDGCPAGWAEQDTRAPHTVRHECDENTGHPGPHVCSCGLADVDG